MTSLTSEGAVPDIGPASTVRADIGTILYWTTLGAAAGGLGGLLIGGVGGRLAMFVLRLTSDDSVRGIRSDDDFIIGRFDLTSTLSLLAVTMIMGSVVGLIVVLGRPFFPKRGMPFAWALAGAITGGAILISADGVDFTLLEPHLLAVAMFIAIPAVGAGLIAWLVEVFPRFWWRRRKLTALAGVAMIGLIPAFPVAIAALLVGTLFLVGMQIPFWRRSPGWLPARIAAITVFAAIVLLGLNNLVSDTREIL